MIVNPFTCLQLMMYGSTKSSSGNSLCTWTHPIVASELRDDQPHIALKLMNAFLDHNFDTNLISCVIYSSIGPLASWACCRPRLHLYALITTKSKRNTCNTHIRVGGRCGSIVNPEDVLCKCCTDNDNSTKQTSSTKP